MSFARIVSSLEASIPDSEKPSSVAFRVTALVFGAAQARITANSLHDTTLHAVGELE
jgi:hypothetical protein